MIRKKPFPKVAKSRKDRLAYWHYCLRNWRFGSAAECTRCNEAKK